MQVAEVGFTVNGVKLDDKRDRQRHPILGLLRLWLESRNVKGTALNARLKSAVEKSATSDIGCCDNIVSWESWLVVQ